MENTIEYLFVGRDVDYVNAKDVRILMRKDGDGRIEDLLVVEFTPGEGKRFPMELYKRYPADLGNALGGWLSNKESSLEMTMLEMSFISGF